MSLMQMIESLNVQDDVQTTDLIMLAFNSELLIRATLQGAKISQDVLFDAKGVKRVAAMLAAHAAPIERHYEPPRLPKVTPDQQAADAVGTALGVGETT